MKQEKTDELKAKSGKMAGRTTIPVSVALQEAENLHVWCLKDKEALVRSGLDWKLVEDLPEKANALRKIQSKWSIEHDLYRGYQSKWRPVIVEAFTMRDDLVHHFYHAFYYKKKEHAKIREIEKGNRNADMIQDLIDLPEFGLKHVVELKAIGFDLSLLDKAKAKSFEIAELQAKINSAHKQSNSIHELRNNTYEQLQKTVKEIRRIGRYVFWKDESRLKGYVSDYLKNMNQRRKKLKNRKKETSDEVGIVAKTENSD
jgi:hypothetical protein